MLSSSALSTQATGKKASTFSSVLLVLLNQQQRQKKIGKAERGEMGAKLNGKRSIMGQRSCGRGSFGLDGVHQILSPFLVSFLALFSPLVCTRKITSAGSKRPIAEWDSYSSVR